MSLWLPTLPRAEQEQVFSTKTAWGCKHWSACWGSSVDSAPPLLPSAPVTHTLAGSSQNTGCKEGSTLALKPLLCAALNHLKSFALLGVALTTPEQTASFHKGNLWTFLFPPLSFLFIHSRRIFWAQSCNCETDFMPEIYGPMSSWTLGLVMASGKAPWGNDSSTGISRFRQTAGSLGWVGDEGHSRQRKYHVQRSCGAASWMLSGNWTEMSGAGKECDPNGGGDLHGGQTL